MNTHSQTAAAEKSAPCISRSPILTKEETVLGYELFFGMSTDGMSTDELGASSDGNDTTAAMIDALTVMGFEMLCDGHNAFINCNRQMLLSECLTLLPSAKVVVEIQETVAACMPAKS